MRGKGVITTVVERTMEGEEKRKEENGGGW